MKKQITLILCGLALVFSGMAHPETGKIFEKFAKKMKQEILNKNGNSEQAKLFSSHRQTLQRNMPMPTKSPKGNDWWEPDTIYAFFTDGSEERRIFTYENGKCTVDLTQNKANNQWENEMRYRYSYNAQNNMTEELGQVWQSGQWKDAIKTTYTYDVQNNVASSIFQFFQSGQWINISKGTFQYDLQNNITEELFQSWSGQWVNKDKYIYEYNAFNDLKNSLFQYWEDAWIDASNEIYTYDAQNNLSEILYQIYEDEEWNNEALQTFYYNELNQCTSYVFQSWAWDFNQWKNEDKVSLTYDAQNNRTSETWQYWSSGQWRNSDRTTCEYDENNNAIFGYAQDWSNNTWVDRDGWLDVFYNNMQSRADVGGHRFTATYIKPGEVGIKEHKLLDSSVKLYPNPVSNMLHIETDSSITPEINIYSIQGALLMNAKGNQIDVSSLPNGIYMAKIDGVFRKIVKQ